MKEFDLFVIGGGSGGIRAARLASSFGAEVAIAESKKFGGTCVNIGCIPKKFFYFASKFSSEFEIAKDYGWGFSNISFSWTILKKNVFREIDRLNSVYIKKLLDSNIKIFNSEAEILDKNTVKLCDQIYKCKNILIATGSYPILPDIEGSNLCITSNEVFSLEKLPKSIIIVGGGYISLEFASIFNSLGVEVIILIKEKEFMKRFDKDIADFSKEIFEKKGIKIICDINIKKINKINNELTIFDSEKNSFTAEKIILATGRKPNIKSLKLDNIGVKIDNYGSIVVDNNFRTNIQNIYAVGDVTNKLNLTPVAINQAVIAVKNIFNNINSKKEIDYRKVPTAIFSDPNITMIGLSEKDALKENLSFKIYKRIFKPMKFSLLKTDKYQEKFLMKLIVNQENDEILGIFIVGPDSAEIIQGFAAFIHNKGKKSDLDKIIPIHPSSAEEMFFMR